MADVLLSFKPTNKSQFLQADLTNLVSQNFCNALFLCWVRKGCLLDRKKKVGGGSKPHLEIFCETDANTNNRSTHTDSPKFLEMHFLSPQGMEKIFMTDKYFFYLNLQSNLECFHGIFLCHIPLYSGKKENSVACW